MKHNAIQLAMDIMDELETNDFRNRFEDSVLHRICDGLTDHGYEAESRQLWNDACCGYLKQDRGRVNYGDRFIDRYKEVCAMAAGSGAFVMPDWGTSGT